VVPGNPAADAGPGRRCSCPGRCGGPHLRTRLPRADRPGRKRAAGALLCDRRAFAGDADRSVDYSPILGKTELDNFHISAGWGTYGFKAAPIVGKTLAELIHSGRTPELIAPFSLDRFYEDTLVSELAAAAVSH
jgi:glycine/D-amino acid oxidase-like deaminating enzyme